MTDASLLAADTILIQADATGDLHPCAYFSKTFSVTEQNDIYDQELLTVILVHAEWKQYLQDTLHPVLVLTNHKNLSYSKVPHKLSHHQACWSLFLQDFDITWKVTPGTLMGPTGALSHKDHIDPTKDNAHTPIHPDPIVINALDLSLSHHIQQSTLSDPFILKALAALNDGSPLFTCTSLSNWSFNNGHLYFCNHMCLPSTTYHLQTDGQTERINCYIRTR